MRLAPGKFCFLLAGLGLVGSAVGAPASAVDVVSSPPYIWKNVKVMAGGFIPGIVFNTHQPGLAYCRSDIGSSYKWDVKAKRWLPLTDWNPVSNLQGSESIATDPVDPKRVYIAQGMGMDQPAAIMRSMDQGRTFQTVNVPFRMGGNSFGRSVGERLAIDPNKNDLLYFGSRRDGLWVSQDAALTWTNAAGFPKMNSGDGEGRFGGSAGLSFVVFDVKSGSPGRPTQNIYVGSTDRGESHLFRSADAGQTWQAVPGQPTNFVPIHASIDKKSVLYIVYDNGVGPSDITDGAVWKLDTKSLSWTDITPVKDANRCPGGYGGLAVDLQHPGTVIVTSLNRKVPGGDDDDRIYRTINGGKTWKDLSPGSHRDDSVSPYVTWVGKPVGDLDNHPKPSVGWWIATLAIDPFDSSHVCYATGATIWNCTNINNADADQDTHWTIWAEGIEETAVLDLASPPSGAHLISAFGDIGGFTHDNLDVSPKDGMHRHPLFTTGSSLDFAETNPNIVIRTGSEALHIPDRDTMAYSLDGGHAWSPFSICQTSGNGQDGSANGDGAGTGPVILSADGSTFMSTVGTVTISTNRGKTWAPVQGLPEGARPVADRANPAKFYALSAEEGKIYRSLDGGATFTTNDVIGLPAMRGGRGPRLLAVPGREGDLWFVGRGSLYHSLDSGASFTQLADSPLMRTLAFGKAPPDKTYVALYTAGNYHGQQGVFRSDDVGATWLRLNDDQNQWGNRYTCIAGDPRIYGRVYVGTDGRGIFYGDIEKGKGKSEKK